MLEWSCHEGVAELVLRRPPVNAVDSEMVRRLDEALTAVESVGARCLVIRSGVPRAFCAGADLAMLEGAMRDDDGIEDLVSFARDFQKALARLEQAPYPTVAAIEGLALGGGLELALACDFRVAARHASLGLTETSLGLVPGAGGTQRLAALLGRARARRMVLVGAVLDAEGALEIGLVDECVDDARIAAHKLAVELASRPARAVALAKACLADAPSAAGYERELAASRELYGNAETIALVTNFLNRRQKRTSS